MPRPKITQLTTGDQFNNWYWLKEEMVAICQHLQLPIHGGKFALRDRIIYALDNDGALLQAPTKPKKTSKFNWAKAELSPTTIITDSITFGPNVRRFFKAQLGAKFSFHTDFMAWLKGNAGKTLADAVEQWQIFELRKKGPNFRSDIADHNMFNQYTRDYLDANPTHGLTEVRKVWAIRRQLPAPGGFIRYQPRDADLNNAT